jgi:hypothetical protein
MKRTKYLLITICFALVFTILTSFGHPALAGAESCLPIKVWSTDRIEPLDATVSMNDCVVWVNFDFQTAGPGEIYATPTSEIAILFSNPPGCVTDKLQASTGFTMNKEFSCFAAGWLRPGETASLVFKTPGVYKYEIRFKQGKELGNPIGGVIAVK